ncbi:MAG: type II secretion system GspH family protein [Defluviitaleaceae bacterium]|nr:type II secretion system GspH family protein [Defluviitaleaceae bacterium]
MKKNKGFTLLELIVTLSIVVMVTAAAGSALFSAFQSYSVNLKIQDDQYNARLALLAMTRDVHRGVLHVEPPDGSGKMELVGLGIEYELVGDRLKRRGDSPVSFVEVELKSFSHETVDDRWLKIEIECMDGLVLQTKISISRIPQ